MGELDSPTTADYALHDAQTARRQALINNDRMNNLERRVGSLERIVLKLLGDEIAGQ